jgi:carbonic anhydrase
MERDVAEVQERYLAGPQPYCATTNITVYIQDGEEVYPVRRFPGQWVCSCATFHILGICQHVVEANRLYSFSSPEPAPPLVIGGNGHNPYVERNRAFQQWFRANTEALLPTFEGQEPHTLWIGCSDSRVPPELLIGARPGELFVHRNIGNVVSPPCSGDDCSQSVVVYALHHLPSVSSIVICGHTDCGAMKALLSPSRHRLEPELQQWLARAEPLPAPHGHPDPVQAMAEANVLLQVERLRAYTGVRERLRDGALAIYGLLYDVRSGQLRELTQVVR